MAHVILNIKDNKLAFFFEFIKNFKFIKIEKTISENEPNKELILKNITTGLEEMCLFKKGKLKTTSAKDFVIYNS